MLALDALAEFESSDSERRIATLLELFDYAWEAADIATADRAVLEAMPMLRDERSGRSARAFAADAKLLWNYGRYTSAREAALQAIAIAREGGALLELARALTILGLVHTHLGETNHAEESFAEVAGSSRTSVTLTSRRCRRAGEDGRGTSMVTSRRAFP